MNMALPALQNIPHMGDVLSQAGVPDKEFSSYFDRVPKTVVYCKASLLTNPPSGDVR